MGVVLWCSCRSCYLKVTWWLHRGHGCALYGCATGTNLEGFQLGQEEEHQAALQDQVWLAALCWADTA